MTLFLVKGVHSKAHLRSRSGGTQTVETQKPQNGVCGLLMCGDSRESEGGTRTYELRHWIFDQARCRFRPLRRCVPKTTALVYGRVIYIAGCWRRPVLNAVVKFFERGQLVQPVERGLFLRRRCQVRVNTTRLGGCTLRAGSSGGSKTDSPVFSVGGFAFATSTRWPRVAGTVEGGYGRRRRWIPREDPRYSGICRTGGVLHTSAARFLRWARPGSRSNRGPPEDSPRTEFGVRPSASTVPIVQKGIGRVADC